ncbi:hypothetical protein FIBSPDRAFT_1043119 [Athelia psychrophila]|uniref:Uncharacterized protein n=1 Tax=Athelia psychrophila TaxID=1759441 RepID=A0A166LPZ0_9AGAM|nr:hypothetical protein FIBSPDRAFT_1043119 [Fibularhizoctonia sp. CBS 109695]
MTVDRIPSRTHGKRSEALLLGILYLALQAFPLSTGSARSRRGLRFWGSERGWWAMRCMPFWDQIFEREKFKLNGHPPPETRMCMDQVGGILVPTGLFFTAYTFVPWIFQILIVASIPCVSPPYSALEARL